MQLSAPRPGLPEVREKRLRHRVTRISHTPHHRPRIRINEPGRGVSRPFRLDHKISKGGDNTYSYRKPFFACLKALFMDHNA